MARPTVEQWFEAERLVVAEGRPLAEAARMCGMAESTLRKRAAEEKWLAKRGTVERYDTTARGFKADLLYEIREKQLAHKDDPRKARVDPNEVYLWLKVEAQFPELREVARHTQQEADPDLRRRMALELVNELVAHLAEHAPAALDEVKAHLRPWLERFAPNG